MNLISRLLQQSNVIADLDVSSKKRVFEQVGLLFENNNHVARSEVFDSLFAREKLGSTGLGQGVAIPHGRLKGLKEAVGGGVRAYPVREAEEGTIYTYVYRIRPGFDGPNDEGFPMPERVVPVESPAPRGSVGQQGVALRRPLLPRLARPHHQRDGRRLRGRQQTRVARALLRRRAQTPLQHRLHVVGE